MSLPFAIQIAGMLQLLVSGANFILPRLLHYRENLAKMTPIMRQIFLVHAAYIVLVLLGNAALCLFFAHELCGTDPLGKYLSGFLALFWSSRVVVQLAYYDRATKAHFFWGHVFFTSIFLYFALVFTAATLHGL